MTLHTCLTGAFFAVKIIFAILLHTWAQFELDIVIANTSDVFLKMSLDSFVPHIDVRFASFSTAVICYFCYFACTKRASFHYPSHIPQYW